MKKKDLQYKIYMFVGIISFFVCLMLGEFFSMIFYAIGGVILSLTIIYICINYDRMIEAENENKINAFEKNIRTYYYNYNGTIYDIDRILIKKHYNKYIRDEIDIYKKDNFFNKKTVILISLLTKRNEQDKIVNEYFENYKTTRKSGPTIYLINIIDKNEIDLESLKKITITYAKKKVDNQIRELSLDENYVDPKVPTVIPIFFDGINKFIGFHGAPFIYGDPIISKYRIKFFYRYIKMIKRK